MFWIILIALIFFTLLVVSFIKKWWGLPIVAMIWVCMGLYFPNVMGYPIGSQLVDDREAVVLYATKDNGMYYILVKFQGDEEPRLVEMPASKENEKAMDEAQNPNQNVVIRFNVENGPVIIPPDKSKIFSKSS